MVASGPCANRSYRSIADMSGVGQELSVVGTIHQNASGKALPAASIGNSLLLPLAAAFHWNVASWVLVVNNFVLMRAIWITQLLRGVKWRRVDWGWRLAFWPVPLMAFGVGARLLKDAGIAGDWLDKAMGRGYCNEIYSIDAHDVKAGPLISAGTKSTELKIGGPIAASYTR